MPLNKPRTCRKSHLSERTIRFYKKARMAVEDSDKNWWENYRNGRNGNRHCHNKMRKMSFSMYRNGNLWQKEEEEEARDQRKVGEDGAYGRDESDRFKIIPMNKHKLSLHLYQSINQSTNRSIDEWVVRMRPTKLLLRAFSGAVRSKTIPTYITW